MQEENNKKVEKLKADNQQKLSYHNNLGSVETQLQEEVQINSNTILFIFIHQLYFQQETLDGLKQEYESSNFESKIEEAIQRKQEVDKKMVEMGEVMKMLTLHSSTRVRLGLKKSEAQAKKAALEARYYMSLVSIIEMC